MTFNVAINLYQMHTRTDMLITWISGLATSREIFWLFSLVSSATASSLFWISTPFILMDTEKAFQKLYFFFVCTLMKTNNQCLKVKKKLQWYL